MSAPDRAAVAEARAGAYRLLARLALAEVDAELASGLARLPVLGEALATSGGSAALQSLRAEYTRLFVLSLPPYESVYLDQTGMLNASSSGAVLECYRRLGFEAAAARQVGAPDHLGLELGLLAELAERQAAAERAGDLELAEALRRQQRDFLGEHLLRWGPIFGRLLAELADTALYRALGEVLETFLLEAYEALAETRR